MGCVDEFEVVVLGGVVNEHVAMPVHDAPHTVRILHGEVAALALVVVLTEVRDTIKHGVKIVWETELMRHFTVKLERIED